MATILFVTQNDIKANSILTGAVDPDKFLQCLKIAQEVHIQNYLGTKLYERLQDYVENTQNVQDSDPEKILIDKFVKDMTIYWGLVEYVGISSFQITNKGVMKHTSETAENASKEEVDYLVQKYRDKAEYYSERFIHFMSYNQPTYPEYNTNSEDDRYPSRDSYFGGWQI